MRKVSDDRAGDRAVDVVFDNVGEAVMEKSMSCLAYNGRYLMMGFASDKTVADERLVAPRRGVGQFQALRRPDGVRAG